MSRRPFAFVVVALVTVASWHPLRGQGNASATASAPAEHKLVRAADIADKTGWKVSAWRFKGINHQNDLQLVRSAMTGAPDGMVLFATEMGATDKVIREVASLGAEITARFDEVGYFRT